MTTRKRKLLLLTMASSVVLLGAAWNMDHLTHSFKNMDQPAQQTQGLLSSSDGASPAFERHSMLAKQKPAGPSNYRSSGGQLMTSMFNGQAVKGSRARVMPDQLPVRPPAAQDNERFPDVESNPLKQVSADPVSTFSVDVDTASYSYARAVMEGGRLPKPDSVRVEEFVNYFNYDYAVPSQQRVPFTTNVSVAETPWNPDTKLMHIGIQGYKPALADLPPQNLVFLIDTSGSMHQKEKMPLLQQSLRMLVNTLRPEDEVSIVTYAGNAGVLLPATKIADKQIILDKISNLTSRGSTAGQAGLKQAYAIAETMAGDGGEDARIILATDGDFNVGLSDNDSLKRYVADQKEKGTSLSILGFGRGNYNDELMQTLAQNGNGIAAYIDTLSEARKVLVDQLVGSITSIAQDVKIQVEFNPQQVAEYRLIGYETRKLKTQDFNNDKVDAGDIGAGHTVTALYEVTPVGSPAIKIGDLRYGSDPDKKEVTSNYDGELAFVKLRYKNPGESQSNLIETSVKGDTRNIAKQDTMFAAAVASFAEHLKGSKYLENWKLADAIELASVNRGADKFGYRSEALRLMRLAEIAER